MSYPTKELLKESKSTKKVSIFMRGKPREFTDEEIQYIVDNLGKESPHSMKKKFNCSWSAVCKIAEKLCWVYRLE